MQAPPPQYQPAPVYQAAAEPPPPWAPQGGKARDFWWIPAIGVLILIVAVGWMVRGFLVAGPDRTPPSYPTPTPTPAGLEFGRAYLFWYNIGLPALSDMNKSVPNLNARCKGSLPATCQAAITVTDQKLQAVINAINTGNIPACLTTHMTRVKSDLEAMDGGLQIALNGYKAADKAAIGQGLTQFHESAIPLNQDVAVVTSDVKALCH
jgi:hypothetical protein